jgi:hypothetical protein
MEQSQPRLALRTIFVASGLAAAGLAAGYTLQAPWALALWPWADGRLSNIFVGSIFAAMALPLLWIGASGQFAAATGGFLHLGVLLAGAASVFVGLPQSTGGTPVMVWAGGAAVGALACGALAAWSHRLPARDSRPLTQPMRAWFVLYVMVLLPGGIALLQQVPGVMPWALRPESSSVYGWVFLSAICSFVYPLLRPRVEYAYVGLLGFLAYDLVLLPPFLQHFAAVKPAFKLTLMVYTSVLFLTACISVWYLFICAQTRMLRKP